MTYSRIREQNVNPRRQTPIVSQADGSKIRSANVLGGIGESLRTSDICNVHLSTQNMGASAAPKSVQILRRLIVLDRITVCLA